MLRSYILIKKYFNVGSRGDAVRIATGICNKCGWEMHWKRVGDQGLQGKKTTKHNLYFRNICFMLWDYLEIWLYEGVLNSCLAGMDLSHIRSCGTRGELLPRASAPYCLHLPVYACSVWLYFPCKIIVKGPDLLQNQQSPTSPVLPPSLGQLGEWLMGAFRPACTGFLMEAVH